MAAVYRLEVPLQGAAATSIPGAAEFWSGLDRRSRVLTASVAASLLLHAILLSTQFKFPAELRWKSGEHAPGAVNPRGRRRHRPAAGRDAPPAGDRPAHPRTRPGASRAARARARV